MRATETRDAAHFNRLYEASPDPWGFTTSPYEQHKYEITLAALGGRRFRNAFEAGCSIGVLTARLGPFCARLLAVDIAPAALAAAAQRCAGQPQICVEERRLPGQWPPGEFDLILLSEMLYFLTPADIRKVAANCLGSLAPGGVVLLVNYTGQTDDPCSGDEAAEIFTGAVPGLVPMRRESHERFRLDMFQAPG